MPEFEAEVCDRLSGFNLSKGTTQTLTFTLIRPKIDPELRVVRREFTAENAEGAGGGKEGEGNKIKYEMRNDILNLKFSRVLSSPHPLLSSLSSLCVLGVLRGESLPHRSPRAASSRS